MQNELLKIQQAADRLNVCHGTVRLWLRQGRLCRVKLGRCVRVSRQSVEELISQSSTPAHRSGVESAPSSVGVSG